LDITPVAIDRQRALELYREYKKHAHYSKPIDRECQRAYQLLAKGRLIIRALESVRLAGVKITGADAGFPKLALCRADAVSCKISMSIDGSADMHAGDVERRSRGWRQGGGTMQSRNCFSFPAGTFASKERRWRGEALVPVPPLNLRPRRGLMNYHVLWEAEWSRIAPSDPYLLRRIGKADMWLVVAMWELTPVEKAALATRLTT
jgi:hypothetical protein